MTLEVVCTFHLSSLSYEWIPLSWSLKQTWQTPLSRTTQLCFHWMICELHFLDQISCLGQSGEGGVQGVGGVQLGFLGVEGVAARVTSNVGTTLILNFLPHFISLLQTYNWEKVGASWMTETFRNLNRFIGHIPHTMPKLFACTSRPQRSQQASRGMIRDVRNPLQESQPVRKYETNKN